MDLPSATLQIIATTDEGTRAALVEARHVARRMAAVRIVLLAPQSDSPISFDRAANERLVDEYRILARQVGIEVTVRLCACSGYDEAFRWLLPPNSLVVVGGRRRWWWPTREQRIVDRLRRSGFKTVFADVAGTTAVARDEPNATDAALV